LRVSEGSFGREALYERFDQGQGVKRGGGSRGRGRGRGNGRGGRK
jgi:hypothetical protein